jgi:hypothetical protein
MAMKKPIDDTMVEARQFFLEHALTAQTEEERLLHEHLRELAEAVQENARMLDVMRREVEELHHVMGVR